MGFLDLLLITICHNVSFMGKTWWAFMLVLRLLVLLLAGFPLFSDEQERFVCNTLQPGCSNVCFDVFAPVSVSRLWLFHLLLLCLPHAFFAAYVMHKVLRRFSSEGFCCDRSLGRSRSSGELYLHSAALPHGWEAPRFHCSYLLVVVLRTLLEVVFGAGQFLLFGLSVPKSVLCREAPCTSGVECYVSRPTEKTLMLNFMLAVASLSVLLSLSDLASSMKASVAWRSEREMLMEHMSKGEQASVFTTTTAADGSEALSTRRISLSGSSKNGAAVAEPKVDAGAIKTTESTNETKPEGNDCKLDMGSPVPAHFGLRKHLRPPVSPRPARGPPPSPRVPVPAGANSGQQSDSSESQDKRAWV